MDVIQIQNRKYSRFTLIFLDIIIVALIVLDIALGIIRGTLDQNVFALIHTTVLMLAIIVLIHMMARRKLLFDQNGIIFTPMAGADKKISYREIGKVDIGSSKNYTIYLTDGTNFASFLGDADNARDALQRMKEMGVKLQL